MDITQIKGFLEKYKIDDYYIHRDLSVEIGNFKSEYMVIEKSRLKKIPFKINKFYGKFVLYNNQYFNTLNNINFINGDIYVIDNFNLNNFKIKCDNCLIMINDFYYENILNYIDCPKNNIVIYTIKDSDDNNSITDMTEHFKKINLYNILNKGVINYKKDGGFLKI